MDSKRLKAFLTERRHLNLLRNFKVYYSFSASPDLLDPASDPDIEETDGSSYFRVFSQKAPETTKAIPVKSTKSFYDVPASWRKLSERSVVSQGAVVENPDKAAALVAAKNTNKKKSD
ncbi:hypothetical protein EVAR_12458_1 [Eumeta japonica]|uniref:Uncharacterized protein n=1 Tax=Eumeta variegata TaxID=151549 RepID=A0A4C1TPH6_EUMVA|nr:hypothetical protein EVAR_12458_1 [Eumeta japonica]